MYAHSFSSFPANSGPLSVVTDNGSPLVSTNRLITSTTLRPGREESVSIARHSLMKLSTMFKHRRSGPLSLPYLNKLPGCLTQQKTQVYTYPKMPKCHSWRTSETLIVNCTASFCKRTYVELISSRTRQSWTPGSVWWR